MAPSVNSPLLPIVIPEIVIPPHFTTLGNGLLQNGHARESPATLAALLLPSPSSPRGIANSSKPKTWWRAQCLHYGIDMPMSATVERMRGKLEEELRSGKGGKNGEWGLIVPPELMDLEFKKNGEFRKLNAQVREKTMGTSAAAGAEKGKGKGKVKEKAEGASGSKESKKKAEGATGSKESKKKTEGAPGSKGSGKKVESSIVAPPAKKSVKKNKQDKEETVTTTTIITTVTKKNSGPSKSASGATTVTKKNSGPSKSGSGAGTIAPAKQTKSAAAKKAATASAGGAKPAGVSKPKPKKELKKEVKLEQWDQYQDNVGLGQEDIVREQREFLNSRNFTSTQGPLPSYLARDRPAPQWQTQQSPTSGEPCFIRYGWDREDSAPNSDTFSAAQPPSQWSTTSEPADPPQPRGSARCSRGNPAGGWRVREPTREDSRSASSRSASPPSEAVPQGRGYVGSAPQQQGRFMARRSRPFTYGGGAGRGSAANSSTASQGGPVEPPVPSYSGPHALDPGEGSSRSAALQLINDEPVPDEPPPAYGSWENDVGDNDSEYSDGENATAVQYEDLDAVELRNALGQQEGEGANIGNYGAHGLSEFARSFYESAPEQSYTDEENNEEGDEDHQSLESYQSEDEEMHRSYANSDFEIDVEDNDPHQFFPERVSNFYLYDDYF